MVKATKGAHGNLSFFIKNTNLSTGIVPMIPMKLKKQTSSREVGKSVDPFADQEMLDPDIERPNN